MEICRRDGYLDWAHAAEGICNGGHGHGPFGRRDGRELGAGHPEKVTDYGYRGIHEMTRIAKAVIQAFYGKVRNILILAAVRTAGGKR